MNNVKPASFLLIKTNLNATKVLGSVKESKLVKWAINTYGPYQVVAYLEAEKEEDLINYIEDLRSRRFVVELDARIVKTIPQDEELDSFEITKKRASVLLINVNYKEEKERVVTYNLRKLEDVVWARAMWGPTDIVAIVQADDNEGMRNKICDEIKTMKGVATNTTLYSYPNL